MVTSGEAERGVAGPGSSGCGRRNGKVGERAQFLAWELLCCELGATGRPGWVTYDPPIGHVKRDMSGKYLAL